MRASGLAAAVLLVLACARVPRTSADEDAACAAAFRLRGAHAPFQIYESETLLFLSRGAMNEDACAVARRAVSTQERFRELVGEPSKGALVWDDFVSQDLTEHLATFGVKWVHPLAIDESRAARQSALDEMQAQIRAVHPEVDAERFTAEMSSMFGASEAGTIQHEIGHHLLGAIVPEPSERPRYRYGTHLPDYLDDLVAVMMEPESLMLFRRFNVACHARVLGRGALDSALAFAPGDRPPREGEGNGETTNDADVEREAGTRTTSRFSVDFSGNEASRPEKDFGYDRLLSLGKFLLSRHASSLKSLIGHAIAGGDFASWIEGEAVSLGFPSSTTEFEEQWRAWANKDREAPLHEMRRAYPEFGRLMERRCR